MTQIITNGRFGGTHRNYTPLEQIEDLGSFEGAISLSSETSPAAILPHLDRISAIKISFPNSADGRGNSIAKRFRVEGYTGPIRASGHVHADQYPLALRSGFDDVEIDTALARRQPEVLWAETFHRIDHTYLARLKQGDLIRLPETAKAA